MASKDNVHQLPGKIGRQSRTRNKNTIRDFYFRSGQSNDASELIKNTDASRSKGSSKDAITIRQGKTNLSNDMSSMEMRVDDDTEMSTKVISNLEKLLSPRSGDR